MNKETIVNETLEVINPREKVRLFSYENRQVDSPFRINKDILNEFRNRSRSIKLMTTDKRSLNCRIIYFDDSFLYVRIPAGFRLEPGEIVILTFPAVTGNYILQTIVYQFKAPILCLKFLDPRKDKRYSPPEPHSIIYSIVQDNNPLLTDKRLYLIRRTRLENDFNISLEELIGRFDSFNEKGEMVFMNLKRYTPVELMEGELINISRGGVMIAVQDEGVKKQSLIFIEGGIEIPDNENILCTWRLFGYVCNKNPNSTICIRFLKRVDTESFEDILKQYAKHQV